LLPLFGGQDRKEANNVYGQDSVLPFSIAALISTSAIATKPWFGRQPHETECHAAELKKKALAGDTKAQLRLGIAFEFGEGVARNVDEAAIGIASPRIEVILSLKRPILAYLYENGRDGVRDPSEAARWYMRVPCQVFRSSSIQSRNALSSGKRSRKNDEKRRIGLALPRRRMSSALALWAPLRNRKGVPRDVRKAADLIQKSARKRRCQFVCSI